MTKLQITTYILICIQSFMLIIFIGNLNLANATYECDAAKEISEKFYNEAINAKWPDIRESSLKSAVLHAEWYDSMCQ